MACDLSGDDIALLQRRTEGWAAGLQMAALSLRGRKDRRAFVASFAGDHRHIADYFIEEVLARQPEAVRTFLEQTSVLERLSGPLCDAITDGHDGQAMLERIEQANLFLVPLDDERHWYRYHRLLADLLRARLQQAQPELVAALHARMLIRAGRVSAAHEALAEALATAVPDDPITELLVAHTSALLAARAGDVEAAQAHLAGAWAICAVAEYPTEEAETRAVAAEVALAAGDAAAAARFLSEGVRLLQRKGNLARAASLNASLQRLRAR
jgi:ATP/maltotriose-dependent transcriptional regulator MalT